ncbi:MAG: hypothetical protein NTY74_02835 [Ignavibacteriae bacterium]|nr:hypothetical protein [Ignavibacteriota bacterium]
MKKNVSINRLLPVIWGFIVMTLISVMPIINFINLFFCAGIIFGGLAGVFSFNKQLTVHGMSLTFKDAVMIGILSGVLSAVAVSGFNIITLMYSSVNPVSESLKMLGDFGKDLPSEVNKQLDNLSGEFTKYGYSPTLAVFTFISNLFIYPLFGAVGALLGATIINNKKKTDTPAV